MDHRPIGVFDSGMGGLTAVRRMRELLPDEQIIYFGDTGRVPYGTRSVSTIRKYAMQDMRFLTVFPIRAAVVACGTVSTTSLSLLQQSFPIPIIGVVEGAARAAVAPEVRHFSSDTKCHFLGVVHCTACLPQRMTLRVCRDVSHCEC